MVIMPDGAKFKMNWKYITYVNHGNSIHFSIVPMYNGPDIVLFPNMENWEKDGAFSLEEREEIIFLLEHLNWKRNLKMYQRRKAKKHLSKRVLLKLPMLMPLWRGKIFLILTASLTRNK